MNTTAAVVAAPAAPPPIALADVAGKWTMRSMPETSDSTLVAYEMMATADASGWTITYPNRKPIPQHVVAAAGDSIVTEAGPYPSVLRKGQQVMVHSVTRLQGGKLVGTFVARFKTSKPESVLQGRLEGTRAP